MSNDKAVVRVVPTNDQGVVARCIYKGLADGVPGFFHLHHNDTLAGLRQYIGEFHSFDPDRVIWHLADDLPPKARAVFEGAPQVWHWRPNFGGPKTYGARWDNAFWVVTQLPPKARNGRLPWLCKRMDRKGPEMDLTVRGNLSEEGYASPSEAMTAAEVDGDLPTGSLGPPPVVDEASGTKGPPNLDEIDRVVRASGGTDVDAYNAEQREEKLEDLYGVLAERLETLARAARAMATALPHQMTERSADLEAAILPAEVAQGRLGALIKFNAVAAEAG